MRCQMPLKCSIFHIRLSEWVFMKNSITLHAMRRCILNKKQKLLEWNKLTVWQYHSAKIRYKKKLSFSLSISDFHWKQKTLGLEIQSSLRCLLCLFLEACEFERKISAVCSLHICSNSNVMKWQHKQKMGNNNNQTFRIISLDGFVVNFPYSLNFEYCPIYLGQMIINHFNDFKRNEKNKTK